MFAVRRIFKTTTRQSPLPLVNLNLYNTNRDGNNSIKSNNNESSSLINQKGEQDSTVDVNNLNDPYVYADKPVEDIHHQIKEGMEPVIKYRLHAEQSYFWPPPFADNDSREIGPYPHDADYSPTYQLRDPNVPWDDPNNRRNFGEVIPEEMEALSIWNMDVEQDFTLGYMMSGLVVFVGSFCGLWWIGDRYFSGALVPNIGVPRELPYWEKYFPGTKPKPPVG